MFNRPRRTLASRPGHFTCLIHFELELQVVKGRYRLGQSSTRSPRGQHRLASRMRSSFRSASRRKRLIEQPRH